MTAPSASRSRASASRSLKALTRSLDSSDDLLYLIFHELRTPLSSIHGYASILLTGELGPLAPPQRQTVERLRELTLYLTTLITNLRQLALLADEPTLIPWEPLEIGKLVRAVCHDLAAEVERKGVRLILKISPTTPVSWAERNGVTQILINLLMNAIKFTPRKGTITVKVNGSNRAIHLTVRDTGVGIPRAVLPKLFRELYHQDRPEVNASGGSGLGLVIVKRNVDRHQGSVSVNSRVGRGSAFHVILPQRSGHDVLKTVLARMIERSRQEREPFSLLLVKAGGTSSEQLDRILKDSIRSDDLYYPLQKAQLIAIVARTTLQGAQVIAQRISQRMQRDPELRGDLRVTLQFGIAAYPMHGRRPLQLLKVAQRHLIDASLTDDGGDAATPRSHGA